METPTAKAIAAWSDVVSLVLVGLTILVGGVDPVRRLWGRSPLHNLLLTACMTASILFTLARLILEGYYQTPGPREFLAVSVVYAARWLWLFVSMARRDTRPGRTFRCARALRALRTLRLGVSTQKERRGAPELVVRRGARRARGALYWRGVEERVALHARVETYEVRLVEEGLHAALLDALGTTEYRRLHAESIDDVYKRFYDVVRTCDAMNADIAVDYSPFLTEFNGVDVVRQAQRVGATDESDLGAVARRVASDACYYILHKDGEMRTDRHVQVINECIEEAVERYIAHGPTGP